MGRREGQRAKGEGHGSWGKGWGQLDKHGSCVLEMGRRRGQPSHCVGQGIEASTVKTQAQLSQIPKLPFPLHCVLAWARDPLVSSSALTRPFLMLPDLGFVPRRARPLRKRLRDRTPVLGRVLACSRPGSVFTQSPCIY